MLPFGVMNDAADEDDDDDDDRPSSGSHVVKTSTIIFRSLQELIPCSQDRIQSLCR